MRCTPTRFAALIGRTAHDMGQRTATRLFHLKRRLFLLANRIVTGKAGFILRDSPGVRSTER